MNKKPIKPKMQFRAKAEKIKKAGALDNLLVLDHNSDCSFFLQTI